MRKKLKKIFVDIYAEIAKLQNNSNSYNSEIEIHHEELSALGGRISDLRCLFENHYHKENKVVKND